MFVKLVRRSQRMKAPFISNDQGDPTDLGVAYHTIVYEADEVDYHKYPPRSEDTDNLMKLDTTQFVFSDISINDVEYLVISIRNKGEWKHLTAPGCTMYIMNNHGKTVDSIRCA